MDERYNEKINQQNEEESLRREERKTVYGDFYRRRATRHEWEKRMHPVPSAILNGFIMLFTTLVSFVLPVFGLATWLIYRDLREGHGQYSFVGLALGSALWTIRIASNLIAQWFSLG